MTAPTPNAPAGEREDLKVGERRFYRLHTNYGVRWREDVGEKFGRVPLDSEMALLDALLAARREVEAAQRQLSEPIGADVLLANFVEEWGETQVPKERFDIAQSLFWKAKKYFAPDERDAATPEEK